MKRFTAFFLNASLPCAGLLEGWALCIVLLPPLLPVVLTTTPLCPQPVSAAASVAVRCICRFTPARFRRFSLAGDPRRMRSGAGPGFGRSGDRLWGVRRVGGTGLYPLQLFGHVMDGYLLSCWQRPEYLGVRAAGWSLAALEANAQPAVRLGAFQCYLAGDRRHRRIWR